MWVDQSVYPKIEIGSAFKPYLNDIFVEAFKNQTFNQDGNESAILKLNYYNLPRLIFQHLAVKDIVNKTEINRMGNGYIIDTLTSVDIQEVVKIVGKVIKIYGGCYL